MAAQSLQQQVEPLLLVQEPHCFPVVLRWIEFIERVIEELISDVI